jgi:hypothetical protein
VGTRDNSTYTWNCYWRARPPLVVSLLTIRNLLWTFPVGPHLHILR